MRYESVIYDGASSQGGCSPSPCPCALPPPIISMEEEEEEDARREGAPTDCS